MKNKGIVMYNEFVCIKKTTSGITLVALVITIIVLLILAGITMIALSGDNGIIKKAEESKEKTEQGANKEQEGLNYLEEAMNQLQNGGIGEDQPNKELPQTSETNPYLPDNSFTKLLDTDLSTGLVITDGTNEYVWVEVPKSITTSALTTAQIETALQNYASAYRSAWTDTWYSGCGIASQAEYDAVKNKMLNSIKTYGGFWIGRYEAGTADNSIRASNVATTSNAVSAQDRYPYNNVTCNQAQELANRNSTNDYTSSLPFGIQWDLTCKYLESKGISQATIKADSISIGNYSNASFTITRGKYSTNKGSNFTDVVESYTKSSSAVLLTTGASEGNKTMNIYDLAGNVYERTLEKASGSYGPSPYRGGWYGDNGNGTPLAHRSCNTTSYAYSSISFRCVLYK